MRILIVGSFEYEMYSKAFVSGFLSLGHNVSWIDTNEYRYKHDVPGKVLSRFQDKYNFGLPLYRMNKDIIRAVEIQKPDFVFFYYCFTVSESTYRRIHELGARFFTYCNDDPYGKILSKPWCFRFHRSIKLADWNFVYRKKNVIDYQMDGIQSVSVLLPYYLNKNICGLRETTHDLPISFIGHFENDGRDQYINALLENNIPVTVFNGSYWEKAPLYESIKGCFQKGVSGERYYETIQRSQIAIIFLSKLNHDTYTRRCFEIPATKTCMLSEYTDDMNNLFPENECAVYFRSKEDFVNKCKYLLSNPDEISRIAQNGYERLMEIGGSEVDRCREIIEKYNEIHEKE